MRKFLLLTLILTSFLSRAAVISLSSASGHPGDEVDITVSISSTGNTTALEVDIPMPDGISFVSGSVTKLTTTQHSVAGDMKNGELRIIMHSLGLESLPSGELLKFKLKLGKTPGDFILHPKVILSDPSGNKVDASASDSRITTLSPFIELSPSTIDFGRQPIRGTYSRSFTLRNTGNEPLTITAINPSAEEFYSAEALPLIIAPNSSRSVTLSFSPVKRASSVNENVTIVSNAINGNAVLNVAAIPFSVNELHVAESLSGNSDETVTVLLRLNNMEPIQGVQATFALPEALEFIEESVKGIGRGSNLSVSSAINGNKLTLLAFSLDGSALEEGNNNVLSFDVKLNGRSGYYYLNPENVILSNREMEDMTSASSGQYIIINSPTISTASNLSFGNIAVGTEGEANLSIYNSGQAPLTIERIVFSNDIFSTKALFPLTASPYNTVNIPITVSPVKEGKQTAVANIYSNDPENRLKTVILNADAFESNQLNISGEPNDDYTAYTLEVSLDNYTEITALQMDIKWIEGMTTTQQDLKLSPRCSDHTYSVANMGDGIHRIIIFSLTNSPFAGNDGQVFSLTFHGENFTGSTLSAENIILSSASGENYISPGSSITVVSVNAVKVSQIELSNQSLELKATETERLVATVLPSNAEIKTVSWSSSNPSVVSVSPEGIVTGVSVGDAVITALANDDSGVKADCKVKIIPTPAESIKITAEGETTLRAGETVKLTATVLPETTTDKTVVWNSDKPEIAIVSQEGVVTAIKVGTTIITATNSAGQTDQITITVIPTPVSGIELSQNSAVLKANQILILRATVLPETATNKNLVWSSNNEVVASVTQEGVVTALSVGNAIITATSTDGSKTEASCAVNVTATLAESIKISAEGPTNLKATETVQLNAIVLPESTTDKSVSWISSNPDVAFVDQTGLVTAISVGEATITATNSGGQTDYIKITVVATAVESISLRPTEATLRATQTLKLSADVLPATATNPKLEWSSSTPSVADVTPDGTVTAVSVGKTVITARSTDGSNVTATCEITVAETAAESITVKAEGSTVLKATETVQLSATVLPETTTDKMVEWKTDNAAAATVSDSGLVTAVSVGSATITATNSAGQTDQITITVIPTPVSKISLNRPQAVIKVETGFRLEATIFPETATNKTVKWSSSQPTIVSIDSDGNVKGLKLGKATIICEATDGSNVTATCEITVAETAAESITVKAEGSTVLKATETVQLSATVLPETTTDKTVTWKTDNAAVATVSDSGLVTAVSVGSASITATNSAGQSASIEIKVVETLVSEIRMSQTEATLRATQTLTLSADVMPATATNPKLEWSSSTPSVADVTPDGTVTALSVGKTVITARATDGSNVTATCEVTVAETSAESITVKAEGSTVLKATETVQLSATVLPETTTDKTVTWKTDNAAVATVSDSGLVTAVSVGSAIITATNSAGQTDQITITVVPTPVEEIVLNRTNVSIRVNEGFTLLATVLPTSATNKNVEWSSSDKSTVAVDFEGNVTGLQLGSAVITCSSTDGSGVESHCRVTVVETVAESIKITAEGNTEIRVSETVKLRAMVLPETTTDKSINWSSSNAQIASVDSEGLVTALSVGEAVISATNSSGQTDQITITVISTPVESLQFNRTEVEMKASESVQLTISLLPETATDKRVVWTSSNQEVAIVSAEGLITAIGVGNADIMASTIDGSDLKAICKVTVIPTPAESIEIQTEGETTLYVAEVLQLTAIVLPETTTDKNVFWQSEKPDIATVDSSGLVTAVSKGETIIFATNSAGQRGQILITVLERIVEAEGIRILADSPVSISVGEKIVLKAEVYPEETSDKTINWESKDETIALIDSTGTVTGIKEGEVEIYAYDSYGHSDSVRLTVIDDTGIDSIFFNEDVRVDVFNINGVLQIKNAVKQDIEKLDPGIYIINGKTYIITRN